MKKFAVLLAGMCLLVGLFSCDDGETYADRKRKERGYINRFLKDNDLVGPIKVISESTFYAQDSTTDVSRNEFVHFNKDGVYMQIVRRGEGQSMMEMAKSDEAEDSTVTKTILCRFLEYDIQNGDTTRTNLNVEAIVDKMTCTYSQRGRSYQASFTEGRMLERYGQVVPTGWLKPLDYVRLTRNAGRIAKVRIIVPHSSGTSNAANYVLPFYYEISYQLGK